MKDINLSMASGHFFYSRSEIRQGENLASRLNITLSDDFLGYAYNLLFKLNDKTPVLTEPLTSDEDNIINYVLTNAVTSDAGILHVELQASDPVTGLLAKSAICRLKVIESIDGSCEVMPEEYAPWVTVINTAVAAATEQAGLAQEYATTATQQAVIAVTKATEASGYAATARTKAEEAAASAVTAVNATAGKANAADVYLKSEVYTKTEVDNKDALKADLSEIEAARGTEPTLGARLDSTDAQLNDIENNLVEHKLDYSSLFKYTTNLFNKAAAIDNHYVDYSSGNLVSNTSWVTSDYTEINPLNKFIVKHIRELAYYDKDKIFINGWTGIGFDKVFSEIPLLAKYFRFSWTKDSLIVDLQQVNIGEVLLDYEPYYNPTIKKENVEKFKVLTEDLVNRSITVNKTDFATSGKNLFDKSKVTSGYVVHDGNGTIYANAGYDASDYIEVEPNQVYTQSGGQFSAWYTADKVFISGLGNGTNPRTITSPVNAKYIRVSIVNISSYQFEKGNLATTYEPYGYKFTKEIPDINVVKTFPVELLLPPKIYALVGQELNIYFDNIMNDKDIKYDFDVVCDIGGQYENYFRVTPTVSGTYPITIKALQDGIERATVTSSIIVSGVSVGNGINKKCLFIGDSTTAGEYITQKLLDNFGTDGMDITLLGTKGVEPNKHEGRSGWTVAQYYTDVDSPFVFSGVFNFSQYIATNALAIPDYVVINLGINDTFTYADDTTLNTKTATMLTQYQGMIDNIKAYNANIKIGLAITIPPAYGQDSFGKAYGNNYTRWRYKRNNFLWAKTLINQFKDKEPQGIYLIPINTNLDTRYNMGLESLPVNARNTKTFESIIGNGNCHPSIDGYWQIADIYWYWLKSFES